MGKKTGISWCDSTAGGGWIGCSKVSAGCRFCFAEIDTPARVHRANMLAMNRKPHMCLVCGQFLSSPDRHNLPTNPYGTICPNGSKFRSRRIFCDSNSDWLDPLVSVEMLAHYLDVLRRCDQCEILLLTKRPELAMIRLQAVWKNASLTRDTRDWIRLWIDGNGPSNIWIGTSIEDQRTAEERIPHLLRIPAAKRFLSVEPLLAPVQLTTVCGLSFNRNPDHTLARKDGTGIDWVICGGESGPNRRPMEISWLESIVSQCDAAGVPVFVKQDSALKPGQQGRISDALWARKSFP